MRTPTIHAASLAGLALTLAWLPTPAPAQTVTNFGYGNMTLNGHSAIGVRPLLLILVNYQDQPAPSHNADYFKSLIFDTYGTNTQEYVNGFYLENSVGLFRFGNAGSIGPLNFTAAEHATMQANGTILSNIIYRAMLTNALAFKNNDANHDGIVSNDELDMPVFTVNAGS